MSLRRKAVSSVKWTFASQIGRQVIQFISTAVLARLLAPSDYGLLAMALVVIGIIELFRDLGSSAALIQRKEISSVYLSSLFWFNVLIGLATTLLLWVLSPTIANLYREPRLERLLQVFAPIFFVSGVGQVQRALLEKNLVFDQLAKIEVWSYLVGAVLAVGMAIAGYGVWSLVFQSMGAAMVGTLLLLISSHWRPLLCFSWREVRSAAHYSLPLTGFNFFNFLSRNADYMIIGRFLGPVDLGYYTLAYRLMLYPLQTVSSAIGRVMFPVFSEIQEEEARFRKVYVSLCASIAVITFPMMGGLVAVCDFFVLTVFGQQWTPVVPLLLILAPVGLLQSIGTTVGNIYQAKGRTDLLLRWGIFSGTLAIVAFIVGLKWGVLGVAAAYAILSGVLIVPAFLIPLRLIGLKFRRLLLALSRPLAATLIMLWCLGVVRWGLQLAGPHWFSLVSLVVLGVIVYAVASWMINRDQLFVMFQALGNRS